MNSQTTEQTNCSCQCKTQVIVNKVNSFNYRNSIIFDLFVQINIDLTLSNRLERIDQILKIVELIDECLQRQTDFFASQISFRTKTKEVDFHLLATQKFTYLNDLKSNIDNLRFGKTNIFHFDKLCQIDHRFNLSFLRNEFFKNTYIFELNKINLNQSQVNRSINGLFVSFQINQIEYSQNRFGVDCSFIFDPSRSVSNRQMTIEKVNGTQTIEASQKFIFFRNDILDSINRIDLQLFNQTCRNLTSFFGKIQLEENLDFHVDLITCELINFKHLQIEGMVESKSQCLDFVNRRILIPVDSFNLSLLESINFDFLPRSGFLFFGTRKLSNCNCPYANEINSIKLNFDNERTSQSIKDVCSRLASQLSLSECQIEHIQNQFFKDHRYLKNESMIQSIEFNHFWTLQKPTFSNSEVQRQIDEDIESFIYWISRIDKDMIDSVNEEDEGFSVIQRFLTIKNRETQTTSTQKMGLAFKISKFVNERLFQFSTMSFVKMAQINRVMMKLFGLSRSRDQRIQLKLKQGFFGNKVNHLAINALSRFIDFLPLKSQFECPITGVDFREFESVIVSRCNHLFSTSILIRQLNDTCPICRSQDLQFIHFQMSSYFKAMIDLPLESQVKKKVKV